MMPLADTMKRMDQASRKMGKIAIFFLSSQYVAHSENLLYDRSYISNDPDLDLLPESRTAGEHVPKRLLGLRDEPIRREL